MERTRSAWEAWQKRDLAGEGIVRLILDGTVVKVRLDKKATAISLLLALGIRRDGQKVALAIKKLGGESEAAWRAVLDDLVVRGMGRPELVTWTAARAWRPPWPSLWDDAPSNAARCTRSEPPAHAPKHLHEEVKAEFNDMVHAKTAADVRLSARPSWPSGSCAAGRSPPAWKRPASAVHIPALSARAVALLRTKTPSSGCTRKFKRRIKTQCLLPCAENCRHAVLGASGLGSDHLTQGRRLAKPRQATGRA